MNFEFLKGLRGLQYVYENCSNAEKLAISMPVQSVFTSRKSAELLAKFIYMAAHNQAMQSMTFVDILSDPTVCKVVNSRKVMNAFHHIRKGGNKAVHGDEQESPEEAVSILHDLHFVAGETACILGLIDKYPRFEESIEIHPEACYFDEKDIEEKAQKMFLDYVEKYNAQEESDNYYNARVDTLMGEFNDFCSPIKFIPNLLHTDEIIEFKAKPALQKTVKQIQEHFARFGMQGLRHLRGEVIDKRGFDYKAELTLYGEDGYTTTNLVDFVSGLMYDLPNADGFKIVSHYFGPNPYMDREVHELFEDTITKMGEHESFTYSSHDFLFIDGEDYFAKFENGEWIELKTLYSPNIINRKSKELWISNHLYLYLKFDFDAHMDILTKLRELIRDSVFEEELQFTEDIWEEGEDNSMLLGNVAWDDHNFERIQGFLDIVNHIIKPIMSECEGSASGEWFLNDDPFAVATWEWTKDGFRIVGTSY